MVTLGMKSGLVLLWLSLAVGCSSPENQPAAPAPPPPPPPPPTAPSQPQPAAPGPASIIDPVSAIEALGEVARQLTTAKGPTVNWRALSPALPDQLLHLTATGPVDGETTTVQSLSVTRVKRGYQGSRDRVRAEITDTSLAPFLRAPFSMGALIQRDSSRGYEKGVTIQGAPAIAKWNERGRSEVRMLVAERFLVEIEADTPTRGLAERVAEALDLTLLTKAAAAATPTSP